MCGWVSIISGCEISVERSDDCVLLAFLHILPESREKER